MSSSLSEKELIGLLPDGLVKSAPLTETQSLAAGANLRESNAGGSDPISYFVNHHKMRNLIIYANLSLVVEFQSLTI